MVERFPHPHVAKNSAPGMLLRRQRVTRRLAASGAISRFWCFLENGQIKIREVFNISAKRLVPFALFAALVIITAALVQGTGGGGGTETRVTGASGSDGSTNSGSGSASVTTVSNSGATVSDPSMTAIEREN